MLRTTALAAVIVVNRRQVRSATSTSTGSFQCNCPHSATTTSSSRAGLIFRKVARERGSRLMLFRLIEGLNATLGDWTEYRKPFREVLPLDEPASAEGQTDDH